MAAKSKANKVKDEKNAGAVEVNDRLINPTGPRENADQNSEKSTSNKGDKNKKTTEGEIEGKEKAKNNRKSSLKTSD